MYELLGISLVLAALLTMNALASLAVAGCWRLIEPALRHGSARIRAEILFGMRVTPPLLAVLAIALFLVPSYVGYEPHVTSETVSKKLAALAMLSAIGVTLAVWRAVRSSFATRSLLREWMEGASRITLDGVSIPTYRIANTFPIIAVVGTFRPRLFIAENVLATLSPEELAAAVAHEGGHLHARDNCKRSLLRACRDLLMIAPCGRQLDQAWAAAAESAADEYAAEQSPETALNLASALVKIAKMVPPGARAAVPLAAFLVGIEETRGVKARVRRLIEIASSGNLKQVPKSLVARFLPMTVFGGLLVIALGVANHPQVLLTVHGFIEHAVNFLS